MFRIAVFFSFVFLLQSMIFDTKVMFSTKARVNNDVEKNRDSLAHSCLLWTEALSETEPNCCWNVYNLSLDFNYMVGWFMIKMQTWPFFCSL